MGIGTDWNARAIRLEGDGNRWLKIVPAPEFRISYTLDNDHPAIGTQVLSWTPTEESFVNEYAPARTYGFLKDLGFLRKNGRALGGSLDNAIVLGETGVLNNALRFEDEFVRHKILDAIGDLALVGYPVIGHLVAHRAGHALHTEFAAKILEETHAWRLVEAPLDAVLPIPAAVNAPVARLAN
jgi:UDP-3-O-[3-hydroxymyristoyl] N-acetylglucosamine deacetylase